MLLAAAAQAEEPAENIVVTAERREEDPQQVPISLAVASGEALDASGVESTLDLPLRTPGLVFSTASVLGQPYLRGVGSDLLSAGADASVAVFVDGVYQTRAVAALQDLFDVKRVEVLKGPQGTLFGRNVTGGAIHILNQAPEPGLGAEVDLLYGSYDKLRVRGALNVPVIEGRVMARLSGLGSLRDGFTENLYLRRKLDDENLWALRGQLFLQISEHSSLLLRADGAEERSTRNLAPKVSPPLSGNPGVALGAMVPPGSRRVLNDTANRASVDAWGTSGEFTWEFDWATLSSLTAYHTTQFSQRLDFEATEIPVLVNAPSEDSKTITQELRLASPDAQPLEWLAGLYYLHEDASQRVDTELPLAGLRDLTDAELRTDALGVFGQASLELWEAWRLTAGLRYSYEARRQDFSETLNGTPVAAFDLKHTWDAWTPRIVAEYAPREWLLAYASIARGFKSGGFNSTAAQPFPFDPEYLWAYELGAKTTWLEGRARFNAAFFYYDYDDIQLQLFTAGITFPQVVNAGSADVLGVEAQWWLAPLPAPFDGLEVDGGFAWLDARFSNLVAVDPNNPGSNPDRSGNRLPRAPEFSVFAALQYRLPLWRYGTLTPRVEYRYQSGMFFSIFEDPFVRQGAYDLWNLGVAYESPRGHWYVAGFLRNLGDERYAQNVVRSDGFFGTLSFWGAPRTYGFQMGLRY